MFFWIFAILHSITWNIIITSYLSPSSKFIAWGLTAHRHYKGDLGPNRFMLCSHGYLLAKAQWTRKCNFDMGRGVINPFHRQPWWEAHHQRLGEPHDLPLEGEPRLRQVLIRQKRSQRLLGRHQRFVIFSSHPKFSRCPFIVPSFSFLVCPSPQPTTQSSRRPSSRRTQPSSSASTSRTKPAIRRQQQRPRRCRRAMSWSAPTSTATSRCTSTWTRTRIHCHSSNTCRRWWHSNRHRRRADIRSSTNRWLSFSTTIVLVIDVYRFFFHFSSCSAILRRLGHRIGQSGRPVAWPNSWTASLATEVAVLLCALKPGLNHGVLQIFEEKARNKFKIRNWGCSEPHFIL